MPREDPTETPGEPTGAELRASEVILYRWSAPGGRGLLTNLRCLVLGHPRPVRRKLLWSQELERVRSLTVEKVHGLPGRRLSTRGSFGGGAVSPVTVDPTYQVVVDGTSVFLGESDRCADLQRRIDDARASRCVALYGRVLPFGDPMAPT